MEDFEIVGLYFERDEKAIAETAAKYGAFCHSIALNILTIPEDAEECVNEAYWHAWNAIPPQKPDRLGAWLGRVVRNIAVDIWRKGQRQKRSAAAAGMEVLLDELEDCIPSPETVEREIEGQELSEAVNRWLASLPKGDRTLFVRRYWFGESVEALAGKAGKKPAAVAKKMYRLRQSLKSALEKEGYIL